MSDRMIRRAALKVLVAQLELIDSVLCEAAASLDRIVEREAERENAEQDPKGDAKP